VGSDVRSAPTTADVSRIGAIANPVVRNLNITECYARLAGAFAAQSRGPGANWCTFATWASRQAGETIRGEDVLDDLQRRLSEGRFLLQPLQTLWRRLLRLGLLQPETRRPPDRRAAHSPRRGRPRERRGRARQPRRGDEKAAALHLSWTSTGTRLRRAFLGGCAGNKRHLEA
jgi:hypothetical protein